MKLVKTPTSAFSALLVLAFSLVPLYELSRNTLHFDNVSPAHFFLIKLNLNLGLRLPNYTDLVDIAPVARMWNPEEQTTKFPLDSEVYKNSEAESEKQRLKETLTELGKWSVIFNALERVLDSLLGSLVPRYISTLNSIQRRTYVSYAVSLVHSGAVSFLCVKNIVKGLNLPMEKWAEIHPLNQQISRLMTGYFINDLIGTRHVWLKNPADLWHHLFGIILCGVSGHMSFSDTGPLLFYIPHIAVIEISTVFINIAILIRGLNTSPRNPSQLTNLENVVEKYAKLTFAFTFILLRCVFYPLVLLRMHTTLPEQFRQMGSGLIRPTTAALAVLQYYWAYKIYRMVSKQNKGK